MRNFDAVFAGMFFTYALFLLVTGEFSSGCVAFAAGVAHLRLAILS